MEFRRPTARLETTSKRSARFSLPTDPTAMSRIPKGGVRILYRAFHTTRNPSRNAAIYFPGAGAVVTWDGRLDNRAELSSEFE